MQTQARELDELNLQPRSCPLTHTPMVDLSGPLETLDPFGEPWDEQNGTFYITATVYATGPNDPHDMSDEDRFGQDRRRPEDAKAPFAHD